jgi:hypothetical protein
VEFCWSTFYYYYFSPVLVGPFYFDQLLHVRALKWVLHKKWSREPNFPFHFISSFDLRHHLVSTDIGRGNAGALGPFLDQFSEEHLLRLLFPSIFHLSEQKPYATTATDSSSSLRWLLLKLNCSLFRMKTRAPCTFYSYNRSGTLCTALQGHGLLHSLLSNSGSGSGWVWRIEQQGLQSFWRGILEFQICKDGDYRILTLWWIMSELYF